MNEKPLLSREYNISMDMFRNAFIDFQKKFSYPKNIIMTCAFSLIGVSYIPPLVRNPGNSTCIMIIVVCLFLISGIWLNTFMIRKNLMNSIEGIQGDLYTAEIFENSMNICTKEFSSDSVSEEKADKTSDNSEGKETDEDDFFAETEEITPAGVVKTVIDFVNDDVKILEKKDYYIVYLVKRMFYVIPKNIFSDDEKKILTESFRKAKFIEERK